MGMESNKHFENGTLFFSSNVFFCVECFQARPLLSHAVETEEFEALVDPKLGRNYVGAEMFRMIEAAGACVRHSAAKRPRMGQVQDHFLLFLSFLNTKS